ncbi:concanavalin A-like lectin/glucanase domain-containing protein, partial [Syncephalis pseudoplumigaleata]
IYYYEVEIISKGRDGYIGVGFSSSSVSLKRLPGWELDSWGYHGDDGHKFCCSGTGQKYGPTFTTGDVIGCCVNFANKTAFFTKNGMNLGVAFTDIKGRYFPSVGMRTPQERILANFGDRPF